MMDLKTLDNELESKQEKHRHQREEVAKGIRAAILSGEFLPRERLVASKLAKRFGTSRTPIREALHVLEVEGYVVSKPTGGMIVKHLTEHEIRDYYQVREALECKAIELVCINITEKQLQKAEKYHHDMLDKARAGKFDEWLTLNRVFHDYLYAISGNDRLYNMIKLIRNQFLENRLIDTVICYEWQTRSKEHNEILEVIRKKDITLAQEALRKHLATGLRASLLLAK
jgi:DNA-binding GntR family transcriptional regulator